MKNPALAYAVAICTALLAGCACVVFVMFSLLAEVMATSLQMHMLYALLPTALLVGFSIVFARWHAGAARVFAWLSVPIFYMPIVCVFMALSKCDAEVMAFEAMGVLSLPMLLHVVSRTQRQR